MTSPDSKNHLSRLTLNRREIESTNEVKEDPSKRKMFGNGLLSSGLITVCIKRTLNPNAQYVLCL
jgi:hypothetical protein